jgi:hypothetical protein
VQKALGIKATMEAQAEGLQMLLSAADPALVKFYLGVEYGLFNQLAEHTATAVRGMQVRASRRAHSVPQRGCADHSAACRCKLLVLLSPVQCNKTLLSSV